MNIIEIIMISIAVAMDAFAVSICKGLSVHRLRTKHYLSCGLYFGFFQGLMTFIGFILGVQFQSRIEKIDHWIAFSLLCYIGINMIVEAIHDKEENSDDDFSFFSLLPLAIATSIDALAVGLTLACLRVHICIALIYISLITCLLSMIGVFIGYLCGLRYKKNAEIIGGLILILIGIKILLEHLNIL